MPPASMLCRIAMAAAALVMATVTATAQTEKRYPIIVKDRAELRAFGIAYETWEDNKPTLQHGCYNYGDGSYFLSVSEALLSVYKARGFSRESLCMGLVSEARFDPETGKRLPTYVLFDVARIKKSLAEIPPDADPTIRKFRGKDPEKLTPEELELCCSEQGDMTSEQPLVLPSCFKNANPYSDCVWRYSIKTGERLSDRSVEKFRNLGRAIEAGMKRGIELAASHAKGTRPPGCRSDDGEWPCAPRGAELSDDRGFLPTDGASVIFTVSERLPAIDPASRPIPDQVLKGQDATLFAVSPAFPRGFGYALNASGDAGTGPTKSALRYAAGGDAPKSMIKADRLLKAAGGE